MVRTELLNRLPPIGSIRNQSHVRLSGQQGGYPAPEQGMVVDH